MCALSCIKAVSSHPHSISSVKVTYHKLWDLRSFGCIVPTVSGDDARYHCHKLLMQVSMKLMPPLSLTANWHILPESLWPNPNALDLLDHCAIWTMPGEAKWTFFGSMSSTTKKATKQPINRSNHQLVLARRFLSSNLSRKLKVSCFYHMKISPMHLKE